MKKSELRRIIKEVITEVFDEETFYAIKASYLPDYPDDIGLGEGDYKPNDYLLVDSIEDAISGASGKEKSVFQKASKAKSTGKLKKISVLFTVHGSPHAEKVNAYVTNVKDVFIIDSEENDKFF